MKRWREVSAVVVLLLSLLAAFRVSAEDGAVTRDYISATEHLAASSAADRESNSEIAIVVVDENGNRREIPFSDPHVEDTRNLSWAEFEMLYPPDRGAEKIIHPIPDRPVIIDGVRYAPKEIRRFDGQVLRFIDDDRALREGVLYAFTTREGAEDYMRTE
ncbi:MAG: hypothetical protein IAE81_14830 [Caldilineaceae bacterium]|jgi:hypothetical protein|nr:hypothetical protein [Caldilineaceae bacterium]